MEKVNKSLITSIKTNCQFNTKCLTEHTEDMNNRMERNIHSNENKIATGMKAAQYMYIM